MKASEVKQKIVALIGAKIGRYRQGNIPAIYVGNVPFGQIAEGLEVIVSSYPEYVSTGNQITSQRWMIYLTQFPAADGGDEKIYEAMEILRKELNPRPAIQFVDKPSPSKNPTNDLPFLPTASLRWEVQEII